MVKFCFKMYTFVFFLLFTEKYVIIYCPALFIFVISSRHKVTIGDVKQVFYGEAPIK